MRRNQCLDVALAELEAVGIRNYELAHGSKHLQLRWSVGGRSMRMLTIPFSPGDWRSLWNTRSDIRRLLRLDGMLDMPHSNAANGAHAPHWQQQIVALTRKLNRVNIPDEFAAERDAIIAALRRLVDHRIEGSEP
jgi:hypothetical protein